MQEEPEAPSDAPEQIEERADNSDPAEQPADVPDMVELCKNTSDLDEATDNAFLVSKIPLTCRDQLFMRHDNYVFFISDDGIPCDEGAK
ncbi:hypothetical protein TKK_0015690 [Trichogramma kaykai]